MCIEKKMVYAEHIQKAQTHKFFLLKALLLSVVIMNSNEKDPNNAPFD